MRHEKLQSYSPRELDLLLNNPLCPEDNCRCGFGSLPDLELDLEGEEDA